MAGTLQAATLYWVGGDGGTWSNGGGGWSTTLGGADNSTWNNAAGDTANFDGLGAFTVNLGSDITAAMIRHNWWGSPFDFNLGGHSLTLTETGSQISYNADDGTFSNGTIIFSNGNQYKIGNAAGDAGTVLTIDAGISGGSLSLTKVGYGTLALGGSNTFGSTTINQGTLQVKPGSSLGTGDVTLDQISGEDAWGALTLQTGTAIADDAALILNHAENTLNLDFFAAETVGSLTIDGNPVADGLYTADDLTALGYGGTFTGAGRIGVNTTWDPPTVGVLGSWYAFDDDPAQHDEAADTAAKGWAPVLTTSAQGSQESADAQTDDLMAGETGPVVDPDEGDQSGLQANTEDAGNQTVTFTFSNPAAQDVSLAGFYYDYTKNCYGGDGSNGSESWGNIELIAVSGVTGAADGAVLNAQAVGTANYSWQDVDVDLSAYSIEAGRTATFRLFLNETIPPDGNRPTWGRNTRYDNIALTGFDIPDPASLNLKIIIRSSE